MRKQSHRMVTARKGFGQCACGQTYSEGSLYGSVEAMREAHREHKAEVAEAARHGRPAGRPYVECQQCGAQHEASYDHEGQFSEGPIYAVVCTVDQLTDYYTTEVVRNLGGAR